MNRSDKIALLISALTAAAAMILYRYYLERSLEQSAIRDERMIDAWLARLGELRDGDDLPDPPLPDAEPESEGDPVTNGNRPINPNTPGPVTDDTVS